LRGTTLLIGADQLRAGLDAFAVQLGAQLTLGGLPAHEHAIHFCLALGFQSAFSFQPAAIIFEKPIGPKRMDLWIVPWDLAIEVKYQRPIPSGANRPFPQLFGGILADLYKVAGSQAQHHMFVLAIDSVGMNYLERNNRGLLALTERKSIRITLTGIEGLSRTAANASLAHGPWAPMENKLIWRRQVEGLHLLAWEVAAIQAGNNTE